MGVRSTNTGKGLNTRIDGRLLTYFRDSFIRGGGGTNELGPFSATGGTMITSGSYTYHVFLAPGTFSSTRPISVNYLVVGGGGSLGGGAGGFRNNTTTLGFSYPYAITVGSGGAAAPAGTPTAPGAYNGGPSGIAGVAFATGGGAGGGIYPLSTQPGQPGGSGGSATDSGIAGTTVASPDGVSPTVQGFGGGIGSPGPRRGGGGGAAGAGTNASPGPAPQASGDGGAGAPASWCPAPILAPAIPAPVQPTWIPAVGPTGLFAGGGAGGTEGGTGGVGGGGSGDSPAVDYTGGGGGAAGAGGKGIVIIRYLTLTYP